LDSTVPDLNQFYFDESIHPRGGFILGAYVYGPSADASVSRALEIWGLRPDIDEFKSSARMTDHPEQVALRNELRGILDEYRIGVLIMPATLRTSLGAEALRGLDQFARLNLATAGRPVAFFDEGIFHSVDQAMQLSAQLKLDRYCDLRPEQDSRVVKGIQLADFVAHTCSIMLLETLGLVTKQVKAGSNSGYDPEMELDLGFELWAGLRYRFFFAGPVADQDELYGGALMNVGAHGLYITETCSDQLRMAANQRFGTSYLGCIH
jgi:Protein of unknown function (DUF3800)